MKAAILILLSFPLCVISATYSLPSYRSVDWSLTGVPGGPHDRTTIHATLTSSATAAQIASAIAACTSNQVVKLSAGTYTLSGDVTWAQKRGVTLRGDGKGQTILRFAASGFIDSQVGVSGGAGASLSAGVTKGSTTVTFSTTPNAGFAVDTLFLIQCSDNTNFVFTTTGIGSYVRSTHRITAVSGNDVTFTPPILHTMTGYSPVAFYQVGGPGIVLCGIEDMTIDVGAGVDGVLWVGSDRCWVKSCEITNFTNSGIAPNYAVQNSFLYNDIGTLTNWPNQTDGFGIYYYNVSCFNRDEGNLFNRVGVGRLRSNSSGNYGCFNVYTNIDFQSWAKHTAAVNGSHGAHPMMNLDEGEYLSQYSFGDSYHGSESHGYLYRSWVTGMDVNDAGGNIKLIDLNRGNYTNNIVGNVLGWHPMTNDTGFAYLMTGSPGYTDQAVIIRAGYPNVANNSLTEAQVWLDTYPWLVYPDPVVTNSWIYHCNYDFKTRTKIVISGEETSLADSMVYSATPTNSLVIFPPVNPNDPYILNVTNWQAGHRLIYGTNFVAASGQVSHTRTSISGRTATSGRVVTP